MASRKFKQSWIPTPLNRTIDRARLEQSRDKQPALAVPMETQASTSPQALAVQKTHPRASLPMSMIAQAGGKVAAAADSAIDTAKSFKAGAALLSVAGNALATVQSSVSATALSAARASVAAAVLASSTVPIPSPVALLNRASFVIRFSIRTMLRELIRSIVTLFGIRWDRTKANAQESVDFGERMGGMWVHLTQMASLRGDQLGVEYCNQLALTRDVRPAWPFQDIRNIIEEELRSVGTTFEETFVEFDENPIICRTFGQVHNARLRENQQEVVVRVRAPDAVEHAAKDWRYLRIFLFFAEHLDFEPHMRWEDLTFEVKAATDDLLDFRSEVDEIRRIAKILRARKIYIPQPFRRYCTERMLVSERIQGVSIADVMRMSIENPEQCDDWMRENGIDPRRVWRRLFNAHCEMLFEHNLFFTELNPNGIVLLKGNRLAFVSTGTIGTLDADVQRRYRSMCRAIIDGDYTKACDYYLTLGPALPYVDMTNMKQLTLRALRKWESRTQVKNRPYRDKSIGAAIAELAQCAGSQGLPTLWILARLQLAERTLNVSLEFLDSTRSGLKAIQAYERAAQFRSIKNAGGSPKKIRKRFEGAVDAAQLNFQLIENFENDGENVRRRLAGVQAKLSKVSEVAGRLVVMLSKLAMVVLVVQLYLYLRHGTVTGMNLPGQSSITHAVGLLRPQSRTGWIALILFLFYIRRFLAKIARQLFTKEVQPGDVG